MASTFTGTVSRVSVGFGRDVGHADALVDVAAERIDDRDDVEESRPAQADVAAQAQHRDLLPLAARP